jgi:uncharacterized delta-60 repeat protein
MAKTIGKRDGRAPLVRAVRVALIGACALVLAAGNARLVVAEPGEIDLTFGAGGRVITDLGGLDTVYAVTVQADGRIVAAGTRQDGGNFDIALARYMRDGRLDPTFGAEGTMTTDLGGGDAAYAVAVQPNGRIVVAGVTSSDFALVRYLPDGGLDPTFGRGGVTTAPIGSDDPAAYALAVQTDGGIVIAGTAGFALARYTPDGRPDPSFGSGGTVAITGGRPPGALAVTVEPDATITVARVSGEAVSLARFMLDGSQDTAFGEGGESRFPVSLGAPRAVAVARPPGAPSVVAAYFIDRGRHQVFLPGSQTTIPLGAALVEPYALALQSDGGILVAGSEGGDFALARYQGPPVSTPVTASFTVSTLAGSGVEGLADGPAATAQFSEPRGVAIDAAGNLYVADSDNDCIRKVTPAGMVTTHAGSCTYGFADGPAGVARFASPNGVAAGAGGVVYVADTFNHRIRKVAPDGTVTTLAGTGHAGFADGPGATAQLDSPDGIAVDREGNVYVLDRGNHRVRRIAPSGMVSTLAGSGVAGFADGSGASARFDHARGIAVDAAGILYVADEYNERIRKITPDGTVTTFAGSGDEGSADGPAGQASFNGPIGIAVDPAGNLYVVDWGSHSIRRVSSDGTVTTIAGTGEGGYVDGPGAAARFNQPFGIAVDAAGNVYVGDTQNHRIRRISPPRAGTLRGDVAIGR